MNTHSYDNDLNYQAVELLKKFIQAPSFSKQEDRTAEIINEFFTSKDIEVQQINNNVMVHNQDFTDSKPTILLNSHHDTVKPNTDYTNNPFEPIIEDDKLYGLGSNDAGGCLVALMMTFLHFYSQPNLPYNLILAASAEEEISGELGVASILEEIPLIEFGIVGEPTEMKMAIAEKGLMVLDCEAKGKSGHAARSEGKNAIYEAMEDINWFKNHHFPNESESLGPIKMSVTMIDAGTQHNVIPSSCKFTVDVRTTDAYTNQETLDIIKKSVKSSVNARSTRLNPSGIEKSNPFYQAADSLGINTFGSPTLSDQALMNFPTVKIGPGKSERSHMADEFIYLEEIEMGISGYISLLERLFEIKQLKS